jgi:hypothetical protein
MFGSLGLSFAPPQKYPTCIVGRCRVEPLGRKRGTSGARVRTGNRVELRVALLVHVSSRMSVLFFLSYCDASFLPLPFGPIVAIPPQPDGKGRVRVGFPERCAHSESQR